MKSFLQPKLYRYLLSFIKQARFSKFANQNLGNKYILQKYYFDKSVNPCSCLKIDKKHLNY